jgi:alkylhydroperoxidase family enzyme
MGAALAALVPEEARHPVPAGREDRPKGLNALGTLAHHPSLTRAFNTFDGHVLFNTTLSVRHRELVVLRVAARRGSDYAWLQHVVQGQDAGLTAEEIADIRDPHGRLAWSPLEAALLRAVDELVGDASIGDQTWAELTEHLDVQQLMDLVFTVGCFEVIAMFFRSFGVQPDADLLAYLGIE